MFDPEKFDFNEINPSGEVPAWMRDRNSLLWQDNKVAHDAILGIFEKVLSRLGEVEAAANTLSEHITILYDRVNAIPDLSMVKYKPEGSDYLTFKENLDHIYERITKVENELQ